MTINKKHVGAMAEIRVAAWFLSQGYEVFRNVSPHGPADIVVWRPGERPQTVDVATIRPLTMADGTQRHYPTAWKERDAEKYGTDMVVYYCPDTDKVFLPDDDELVRNGSR